MRPSQPVRHRWALRLAELGGFGGVAFADHLGVRLEETDELAGNMRVALEEAFTRLMRDLTHEGDHPLEVGSVGFQADLLKEATGALASGGNFFGEALGLRVHARRVVQELAIGDLQPLLPLRGTTAARAGDLTDLIAHGAAVIPKARACAARDRGNALHGTREHPHTIAEQGRSARAPGRRAPHRPGPSTPPRAGRLPPGSGPRRRTAVDARARSR